MSNVITDYMGWTVSQCEDHLEMLNMTIKRMKTFASGDELKATDFKNIMSTIRSSMEEKHNIENAIAGVEESEKERIRNMRELHSLRYRLSVYESRYGKIAIDLDEMIEMGSEVEDDQG